MTLVLVLVETEAVTDVVSEAVTVDDTEPDGVAEEVDVLLVLGEVEGEVLVVGVTDTEGVAEVV